jgi:hypothetical protein
MAFLLAEENKNSQKGELTHKFTIKTLLKQTVEFIIVNINLPLSKCLGKNGVVYQSHLT